MLFSSLWLWQLVSGGAQWDLLQLGGGVQRAGAARDRPAPHLCVALPALPLPSDPQPLTLWPHPALPRGHHSAHTHPHSQSHPEPGQLHLVRLFIGSLLSWIKFDTQGYVSLLLCADFWYFAVDLERRKSTCSSWMTSCNSTGSAWKTSCKWCPTLTVS